MDGEYHRRIVDGELLVGCDALLASELIRPENSKAKARDLLFTFVLILAPELVHRNKFPQRVPQVINTEDVYAEI